MEKKLVVRYEKSFFFLNVVRPSPVISERACGAGRVLSPTACTRCRVVFTPRTPSGNGPNDDCARNDRGIVAGNHAPGRVWKTTRFPGGFEIARTDTVIATTKNTLASEHGA